MLVVFRASCVVALIALCLGHSAASAKTASTVAVMPFRDLSGGSKFVGEAIRETVTSDLKSLGSLRVVERGSLDKVLSEQGLQVQQQDMDLATVVKLGKVLGASLIVIGAYQKLAPQVRLTARFVKVETSEIIGTAKVDGSTKEFLRLQDRITAALLRSAGFAVHAKRVLDDSEHRPDLASLKTLELYGQAVVSDNDTTRRQFLTLAVAEDKNFSYATKDLEELEKRLEQYQKTAREVQEKELAAIQEKLRIATNPAAVTELVYNKIQLLFTMRRFHTVVREARAYLDGLSPGAKIDLWVEGVANYLVQAHSRLNDSESLMRDGERWMQRAPGAMNFQSTKLMMESAIAIKRRIEASRKTIDEKAATLDKNARWDLCVVGMTYYSAEQYVSARRLLEACFKVGTHPRTEYMDPLLRSLMMNGDWKDFHQYLAEWVKEDSGKATLWKKNNELLIPTDD